jgi:hypothetical protein
MSTRTFSHFSTWSQSRQFSQLIECNQTEVTQTVLEAVAFALELSIVTLLATREPLYLYMVYGFPASLEYEDW